MPRTGAVKKRVLKPDPLYQSLLVTRLINRVMRSGKKTVAQRQIYRALDLIKEKTKKNPLEILTQALDNIKPNMEVKPRRVGGASYQVPMPVRGDRKEALAIRWLIQIAKKRPNKEYHHFYEKLAAEVLAAAKKEGGAIQKKQEIERMADANRAFSHFRW